MGKFAVTASNGSQFLHTASQEDWVWAAVVLGLAIVVLTVALAVLWRRLAVTRRRLTSEWSARTLAERELSDREQRLQTIFDSQLECVKLHDSNGTILTMNRAGIATLGARCAEQVVGASVYEFIAPEHHERYRALSAAVFNGKSDSMEVRLTCPEGHPRLVETHVMPMRDITGTIVAALAVTRDITDRRDAEERAQRHLSELARFARISSMGEMASGLAHELNQPLTAIVNHASACIRRLQAGHDLHPQVMESLQEISAQGQRAGHIIRNVRALVARAEPIKALVDVNEIVRLMVRLSAPEAARHDVLIRLNLDPQVELVLASKIELEQVVFNLLRNAIEAMSSPHDSTLRVVAVATRRSGPCEVEITVSDSGPGIAEPDIDKIFEPFFSTKVDGMGMGLSISRSIVEAHEGRLSVRHNPDRGVTFQVVLPLLEERRAA